MRGGALPPEPGQQVGTTGTALPGFAPAWLLRPVCGGPGTCLEITVAARAEPDGSPDRTLRATLDYGLGAPTFIGRLALGRRAFLVAAAGMAPGPYRAAAAVAARLIDAVFPNPSAVDARTRFATWLGVTSGVDRPGELLAVKLYANLHAPGAPATGGEAGLAARWPAWAQVAPTALADSGAEPCFAAVRVAATGASSYGLYVRPRASRGHELLTRVSALCGVDPNLVLAGVHESGLSRALWTGDMVVKVEAPEAGTSAPDAPFRRPPRWRGSRLPGSGVGAGATRPAPDRRQRRRHRSAHTGGHGRGALEMGALRHRLGLPSGRRPSRHQRVPRPRWRALSERSDRHLHQLDLAATHQEAPPGRHGDMHPVGKAGAEQVPVALQRRLQQEAGTRSPDRARPVPIHGPQRVGVGRRHHVDVG